MMALNSFNMVETQPVVNLEDSTILPISEDDKLASGVNGQEEPQASVQAGDKTPPNLLLKSLQDEREKVRQLEEELNSLKSSNFSETPEIDALRATIDSIQNKLMKTEILETYPVLKDKWQEFEEFHALPENSAMPVKTAAKAFIAEKELNVPVRLGLERPTSGRAMPTDGKMTPEDIADMRKNNFRKYQELLKTGKI
ncbi:MAG: hypothetical protein HY919_02910 [Elusimicrobia bacterium]|nr:hypothetical protein [Elusimicrobiota bacterium]